LSDATLYTTGEEPMANCSDCGLEMLEANSCTANSTIEFLDGSKLPSIAYVDPVGDGKERYCHDCGVVPGGKHHPTCDMERCPRCGGQLITCGCVPSLLPRALRAPVHVQ
jgi:hypothetical protein